MSGMPDRRRDKRFKVQDTSDGSLQIFPDVVVQQSGDFEWIGISRKPAVAGETLVLDVRTLDNAHGELRHRVPVCVIDCRPIIVDGDLRRRIRLHSGGLARVLFEQQVRRA